MGEVATVGDALRRARVSIPGQPANQFGGVEFQGLSELHNVTQSKIASTLLNRTDVRTVKIRTLCELFLRQFDVLATLAHASSELFQGRVVGRH
jgi:hypothetical protein